MTDLQSLCSRTVAYMVNEFNATHNMAYVYRVLEEDVPYIAKEIRDVAPDIPYNTAVVYALETSAIMFNQSLVLDQLAHLQSQP